MNERMESILETHKAIWPGGQPLLLDSAKGHRSKKRKTDRDSATWLRPSGVDYQWIWVYLGQIQH